MQKLCFLFDAAPQFGHALPVFGSAPDVYIVISAPQFSQDVPSGETSMPHWGHRDVIRGFRASCLISSTGFPKPHSRQYVAPTGL
jgi:hypothetical protein